MFETNAIFYLPLVTLMLFMAIGFFDLQATEAAIRDDKESPRRYR